MREVERLIAAGGKRLRPAFAHWGFVGAGGDPDDPRITDVGAALELLHAFALFHDDVMDGSTSRRGEPVTHEVFRREHEASGSSGESRRFGDGIAILVGDLTFVYSDRLVDHLPSPARAIWHELRIELNVGQLLDIMGSARNDRRLHKAERICRYKSGKYTIERPLHLGAALAAPERCDELTRLLSTYGLPLGDAFQMRDDVMGAFGDSSATGKPVGDDLREGKPTPMLARALELADEKQRRILERVGRERLDDDAVAAAQRAIIDSGALHDVELRIASLTERAKSALRDLPFGDEAIEELALLADYVSGRST